MNIYFVEKFSEGDTDRQIEGMKKYFTFTNLKGADVIYCASISVMKEATAAKVESGKPLVVYCWDYYKWAHEGKHESHNWGKYRDFLRQANLVIVPSKAQQLRLKELLNLDSVVVKSGIPVYEHEVTDGNFILDPLRYYPDENAKWAEKAAEILGIPIIHSEHGYSEVEFRKLVASCTFMTSCVREASTGGLTLMEGLWLGKLSLVSDSPYMGAKDYLGAYGTYFKHEDFNDLVRNMKEMWEYRVSYKKTRHIRKYMRDEFSYESMAHNLHESIRHNI